MDYISVKEAAQKWKISERRKNYVKKADRRNTKIQAFLDDSQKGEQADRFTKKR